MMDPNAMLIDDGRGMHVYSENVKRNTGTRFRGTTYDTSASPKPPPEGRYIGSLKERKSGQFITKF